MSPDKLFDPYFPTFVKTLETLKIKNCYLNTRIKRALLSMTNMNV